jgi:hypothetical protein
LELEWFEESKDMTDDDFKGSMLRYAALAEAEKAPCVYTGCRRPPSRWGGRGLSD